MKRTTLFRLTRRFARNEEGAIAMEGAIVMSIMAILLLVMVDIGFFISTKVELEQALRAGAQKALVSTSVTDITAAVQAATSLDVTVAAKSGDTTTTLACYCDDGSSTDCENVSGGCTTASSPQGFAEFTASANFSPLFINAGFFSGDMVITEYASIRVQ